MVDDVKNSGGQDKWAQVSVTDSGLHKQVENADVKGNQQQVYSQTINTILKKDSQTIIIDETIEITVDFPTTNAPNQPKLPPPASSVQGQPNLPPGPKGTGNPYFNVNPMATFYSVFLKVMQMQNNMQLIATKLGVDQTNLMVAEAKDQATDIEGSAEVQQKMYLQQASTEFAQAGVSFAQVVGTGVMTAKMASEGEEDTTNAFHEMEDAQHELSDTERGATTEFNNLQKQQGRLAAQEDRLSEFRDPSKKTVPPEKPEGTIAMKMTTGGKKGRVGDGVEGADKGEDSIAEGELRIKRSDGKSYDVKDDIDPEIEDLKEEQNATEHLINDKTKDIKNKEAEIRELEENKEKMNFISKKMKINKAKDALKELQNDRTALRKTQNELETKIRDREVDKVKFDDGDNLPGQIDALERRGAPEGSKEYADLQRLKKLRGENEEMSRIEDREKRIQDLEKRMREDGMTRETDPDAFEDLDKQKAAHQEDKDKFEEQLKQNVKDAQKEVTKAQIGLEREGTGKVKKAQENFYQKEAAYSSSIRSKSEKLMRIGNHPSMMMMSAGFQSANAVAGGFKDEFQAEGAINTAKFEAQKVEAQTAAQIAGATQSADFDLKKTADSAAGEVAQTLTQMSNQQTQLHLGG